VTEEGEEVTQKHQRRGRATTAGCRDTNATRSANTTALPTPSSSFLSSSSSSHTPRHHWRKNRNLHLYVDEKIVAKHCPPSRQQHREKQTKANREGKQRLAPLHGEELRRKNRCCHRAPQPPTIVPAILRSAATSITASVRHYHRLQHRFRHQVCSPRLCVCNSILCISLFKWIIIHLNSNIWICYWACTRAFCFPTRVTGLGQWPG
jgi:hypothetical protein